MERITMSIDDDLAAGLRRADRSPRLQQADPRRCVTCCGARSMPTASSTIRARQCVASLSYVYNHHVRDLAERLTIAQHAHHDLVVATTHVHLDHEHCLENVFLKGSTAAVRTFADRIRAERGVTHGQINLITVDGGDTHTLSGAHHHHGHMHLTPQHG